MNIEETGFRGLVVLNPVVFLDDRGYFMESFSGKLFNAIDSEISFVQDNESCSNRGVLRGLHYQIPPFAQAKLVRVVRGAVLDVVVDLRKSEPTYGKHFAIELSASNKKQLFIPAGFAHGFLVHEDQTVFCYKCSEYYSREHERSLLWNDPALGINWGISDPIISPKDAAAPVLAHSESHF
ncbi:MAG: dTDP-4-dehydrorhamnose 3,5-epimerase [Bacteroidota bacterium]